MHLDTLKAYTERHWTAATDTHVADPACCRLAEAPLRGILETHVAPGANVLDIGCGNGEYTAITAVQAGRVLAFDLSESLLAAVRKRCEALDNVSFLQANASPTRVAFDGQAHAIFRMGVFAWLPDDAQVLRMLDDFAATSSRRLAGASQQHHGRDGPVCQVRKRPLRVPSKQGLAAGGAARPPPGNASQGMPQTPHAGLRCEHR